MATAEDRRSVTVREVNFRRGNKNVLETMTTDSSHFAFPFYRFACTPAAAAAAAAAAIAAAGGSRLLHGRRNRRERKKGKEGDNVLELKDLTASAFGYELNVVSQSASFGSAAERAKDPTSGGIVDRGVGEEPALKGARARW
uniref:Uncharacterized protein n=1 Tax=Vespula pensylvanica TaxID=30213 RepID=A0A834P260_VESPE|nr:hypothetical protein H0235_007884 [Vespula pensylvanica]